MVKTLTNAEPGTHLPSEKAVSRLAFAIACKSAVDHQLCQGKLQ